MKRIIKSSSYIKGSDLKPNGGDGVNYATFYTGPGYPSYNDIVEYAELHGFSNIFWASDEALGYRGIYNGDTYVVFNDASLLPFGMKNDAERYGKPIE